MTEAEQSTDPPERTVPERSRRALCAAESGCEGPHEPV